MNLKVNIWIPLLSAFAVHGALTAQSNQALFHFHPFSAVSFFADKNIRTLFQDSTGYLWVGVDSEGLCKYDGSTMQVFGHESYNDGIASNYIYDINQDAKNLWVGTENGLNILNMETQAFSEVFINGKSFKEVMVIHKSTNNQIWVGHEQGLHIYRRKTPNPSTSNVQHSIGYERVQSELSNQLQGISVKTIFQENDERSWIGTKSGLYLYTHSSHDLKKWTTDKSLYSMSDNEVNAITKLSDQFLLIGTDNGVNLLDTKLERFERLEFTDSEIFNDGKVGIVDLFKDSNDNVWIGTTTYGIITGKIIRTEQTHKHIPVQIPNHLSGLTSSYITKIFEGSNNQIWISTKFGGISLYDPRSHTFPHYELEKKSGVAEHDQNFILSAAQDSDGNIWIGTRNKGLIRFSPDSFKYQEQVIYQERYPVRRIETLFYDADSSLWIGHKKGLNEINLQSGKHSHYELPKVVAISQDSNNTLWIGTRNGLYLLDKKKNSIYEHASAHHSLFSNKELSITSILLDSNDNFWIGTDGNGLFHYDPRKDRVTHYFHQTNDIHSLSGNAIRCIYEETNGSIWVGTKSSGLNIFENNHFKHISEIDGLPTNTIFSILEDDKNNLWITTNNGIAKYHTDGTFSNFTKLHGLQGNVFEKHAAIRLTNGQLFLAGNNGYNLFDPNDIHLQAYTPPVLITEIKANAKVILKDVSNYITLTLPYHQNILSFQFATLDFRDVGSLKYQYRLEGVDPEWIRTNHNNVTYSGLSHGTYHFQLMAANADGIWLDQVLEVALVVEPPLWLSWWAFTLYGLLIIGLLYSLYWLAHLRATYTHNLKTKDLEIRQVNELHQLKLNFFTNISHELRTPLTLILSPLEKLRKSHHRVHVSKSITLAYKSARQLLHLTDQLMSFQKAEQGNLPLRVEQQTISKVLKELFQPYFELAESKKIHLSLHIHDESALGWFDIDKLEKILNNLTINAFKYTPENGSITITTSILCSSPNMMRFTISDTGEGIFPDNMSHIFDRYYQADQTHKGSGIGLELVKTLVELHHGEISVKSKPGSGTQFEVLIPYAFQSYTQEEIATKKNQEWPHESYAQILKDYQLPETKLSTHQLSGYKILVVEDHSDMRTFLAEMLNTEFLVQATRNGQEALRQINLWKPDMILADVMLPKYNGLDLCRKLKEDINTCHIPIILLTARALETHQIEGFESGADAYITKPFDVEVLMARIRTLLKNRERLTQKIKNERVFDPGQIATNDLDAEFMNRIMTIIHENYHNTHFSVEGFAQDLNMSRSQLFRKLKSLTNQTPSEYLYSYRIKKAIELLKQQQQNISEIAYQTGFSSPNSFTKTFTKHMGVSPSRFLQMEQRI